MIKNPELNSLGTTFIELTKKEADEYAKLTDIELLHSKQIPEGLELKDMEGACPGSDGEVQLVYALNDKPQTQKTTEWKRVDPDKNFPIQWKLNDLSLDSDYTLEVRSRKIDSKIMGDKSIGSFKTPPNKDFKNLSPLPSQVTMIISGKIPPTDIRFI